VNIEKVQRENGLVARVGSLRYKGLEVTQVRVGRLPMGRHHGLTPLRSIINCQLSIKMEQALAGQTGTVAGTRFDPSTPSQL
jgi:hypothetical protein